MHNQLQPSLKRRRMGDLDMPQHTGVGSSYAQVSETFG